MKKEYHVKIDIDLSHRQYLKQTLQLKRVFKEEKDWFRFRRGYDGWYPESFICDLSDEEVEGIKDLGYGVEDYVLPPCSCGYCNECCERDRERELEAKMASLSAEDRCAVEDFQEMIAQYSSNLSDEAKEVWEFMHVINIPCIMG